MNRLKTRSASCRSKCLLLFAIGAVCVLTGCHRPLKARIDEEEVASSKASIAGDTTGAVSHLKAAIALEPGNLFHKYHLAFELKKAGRIPEAIAMYRTIVATKNSDDPNADLWIKASKQYLAKLAP